VSAARRVPPKPAPSLRRRVAVRPPKRTVAIFCEGHRTEPEYFLALKRDPRVRELAAVELRVEASNHKSSPMSLVRRAVAARERNTREEGEIDSFWCIFDVEWPTNHPDLHRALTTASANNVEVAVSNPCFELWLLLHFTDQNAWVDTDRACKLRKRADQSSGKEIVDGPIYMRRRNEAISRAAALESRHQANGTAFPHNNPSSGVHRLVATLLQPPP
jgi:hypothetical protein